MLPKGPAKSRRSPDPLLCPKPLRLVPYRNDCQPQSRRGRGSSQTQEKISGNLQAMASARGSSCIGLGGSRQAVLGSCNLRRAGTRSDPEPTTGAGTGAQSTAARAALALIAGYKRFLSPLLPRACRFSPSCSEYARLAILKYGFFGGARRAVGRVLRCHPFHPGGVDLP